MNTAENVDIYFIVSGIASLKLGKNGCPTGVVITQLFSHLNPGKMKIPIQLDYIVFIDPLVGGDADEIIRVILKRKNNRIK